MKAAAEMGGYEENALYASENMSHSLKRSLTTLEIAEAQNEATERGGRMAVWKFGPSKFTFGILNRIKSVHKNGKIYGEVSQDFCVISEPVNGSPNTFAGPGDSGSVVWSTDGHVVGLLTSGNWDNPFVTYVTPMELVLDDIKRACGAKKVEMVVKKEN